MLYKKLKFLFSLGLFLFTLLELTAHLVWGHIVHPITILCIVVLTCFDAFIDIIEDRK